MDASHRMKENAEKSIIQHFEDVSAKEEDALFDELLRYGIQPVVTLSHFEMPYNLAKNHNGWLSRYTLDCFVR